MKKIIIIAITSVLIGVIGFFIFNSNSMQKPLYQQTSLKEYKSKLSSKETFVIYIHKTSCSACQQLKPTINEIIKEKNIKWLAVNVEEQQNFDLSFLKDNNISKTPTLIYYKNGIENQRLEGIQSKKNLLKLLKSANYL